MKKKIGLFSAGFVIAVLATPYVENMAICVIALLLCALNIVMIFDIIFRRREKNKIENPHPSNPDNQREEAVKMILEIMGLTLEETLIHAADLGNQEAVEFLVDAGADPNTKGIYGQTPLHSASGKGHRKAVEFLVSAGANPDAKDDYGRIPLYWAIKKKHQEVIKFLEKLTS